MHEYGCVQSIYLDYVQEAYEKARSDEVGMIRDDLARDLQESPDYQKDAKRNGVPQPMVFTRGGEDHGYNVTCLPGDELFAGDIIDAFNEKWIVMRARADTTTHKVGVMYQCNKLLRFQNFDTQIHERWSYIDVSGYSSSFNSSTKMQNSSEQMIIYLPFDEASEKIYVDKRLAINSGYDRFGRRMLDVLKVTGANPIAESFNSGDHLLMLKVERDLFNPESDDLESEICDYRAEDAETHEPVEENLTCRIEGRAKVRIGKSARYKSVFLRDGEEVTGVTPQWSMDPESGVTLTADGDDVLLQIRNDESLIGAELTLCLGETSGAYGTATLKVEVDSLV